MICFSTFYWWRPAEKRPSCCVPSGVIQCYVTSSPSHPVAPSSQSEISLTESDLDFNIRGESISPEHLNSPNERRSLDCGTLGDRITLSNAVFQLPI